MMNSSKLLGRKAIFVAVSVLALGTSAMATAGSQTSNLSVTATVIDNCAISTTSVGFGNYDPIVANAAAKKDGQGTVTITCTDGTSPAITLGQGANADAGSTDTAPLRRMADGSGDFLAYFLYSDASHTLVWGNDATVDVDSTGDGTEYGHDIYGQITEGQASANAGSYSDTVVATVSF